MKILTVTAIILAASVVPAHASTTPNLSGFVCVDPQGIHHDWKTAFDGKTFCKLIPNPHNH